MAHVFKWLDTPWLARENHLWKDVEFWADVNSQIAAANKTWDAQEREVAFSACLWRLMQACTAAPGPTHMTVPAVIQWAGEQETAARLAHANGERDFMEHALLSPFGPEEKHRRDDLAASPGEVVYLENSTCWRFNLPEYRKAAQSRGDNLHDAG